MFADLALDLPAGPADPSQYANQIDQFRAKVPVTDGTMVGLTLQGVGLEGTAEAPVIQIAFSSTEPFVSPDIFIEGPDDIFFGRPEATLASSVNLIV